jgi:CHAT domain-containing protein
LYAGEIYDLQLDSTQLVILSACETGAGQLVRGEGLMSLSRAFAYAGCPNIITSLWKAEDKATAFIAKRLHYYLQKNYSNDEALRQAKLDFLKSKEVEPRFKTPNYWAHFIFIGNYQHERSTSYFLWIVGVIILLVVVGFIIKKMVPHKAGPQFS